MGDCESSVIQLYQAGGLLDNGCSIAYGGIPLSRRVKPMAERDLPRDRKFVTFRLLPEDRALLQHLGRGRADVPDRHAALLELAAIVRRREYPEEEPEPQRRSIRLGIPTELDEAIKAEAERTGSTYVSLLLRAAREYRRRYPLRRRRGD